MPDETFSEMTAESRFSGIEAGMEIERDREGCSPMERVKHMSIAFTNDAAAPTGVHPWYEDHKMEEFIQRGRCSEWATRYFNYGVGFFY